MKGKQMIATMLVSLCMAWMLSIGASALEYTMDGVASEEYYPSTCFEDTYGARYNYGGQNPAIIPELPYGRPSNTSIGAMERSTTIGAAAPIIVVPESGVPPVIPPVIPGYTQIPPKVQTQFTQVKDVQRNDGSIGTLKIPSLGINVKVFDGEGASSMKKGVGHFTTTSAWDGNIEICGHNRGSTYVIGDIKDLTVGSKIQYVTSLGTRTYSVTTVAQISSTDWSYLDETTDNRITMITCVANKPTMRWCVQAVEV